MTSIDTLRAQATARFLDVWTQQADVTRPDGTVTYDPVAGYSDPTTTVATGMGCSLQGNDVNDTRDVAGDPATQVRLELRHDPTVGLRVDDRVTFTAHPDASLVGVTFYVVGVSAAYQHVYGLVFVQRTAPDSGG